VELIKTEWNSLPFLQGAATIAALILTIGAVVEYREKLKTLSRLLARIMCLRATPFERCAFKKLLGHSLGPILVVIGIAGEVIFEGRAFIVEDLLSAEYDRKVNTARQEASDALSRAKTDEQQATQQFGEVRKQAKEARTSLEKELSNDKRELQEAVVQLREKVGDRHLKPEQQTEVGIALRFMPGKKLNILVLSKQDEAVTIGRELLSALDRMGNKDSAQLDCSFFIAPSNSLSMHGMRVEIAHAGKSDRALAFRLVPTLRKYFDDVEGPVPVREFSTEFPFSTTPQPGSERGEGTIDPEAHIRLIIGRK
jgi:hypothetical protein